MSIIFATGQHSPGHARQLIRDCHHHLVVRRTLRQPMYPLSESSGVVLDAQQDRTSTVDQHATQIRIAPLAHAEQLLLASGGVLSRYDAQPSREVASPPKRRAIADGSHGCGRDQRAEAGNLAKTPAQRILLPDALDRLGDRLNINLHLLPLLPQTIQQPAQARAQVLLSIFDNRGQVLAQVDGPRREREAAFQQKAADLVDQCGATLYQSIPNPVHGLDIELLLAL